MVNGEGVMANDGSWQPMVHGSWFRVHGLILVHGS